MQTISSQHQLEHYTTGYWVGWVLGGNTFSEKLDICLKQRFSVLSKVWGVAGKKIQSHLRHLRLVGKAFLFYKGNLKIYKGKYAIGAFWLSILTHWSNQSNFLTRMPHFYWRFSRHPYQYDFCPSSVIADIWNMSIMSDVSDDWWQMADISHINMGV